MNMFHKTSTRPVKALLILAMMGALMAGLSGCSSMSAALGMEKSSPDEFAIITKAPLIIPPDFSLRPPKAGTEGPVQSDPASVAAKAVFKTDAQQQLPDGQVVKTGQSDGELTLLASAGVGDADPSIRTTIEDEFAASNKSGRSVTDRMMFWKGDGQDAAPPKIVGRPVAKEQMPVKEAKPAKVKEKKKSFADRIFFWRKSDKEPAAKEEAAEDETAEEKTVEDAEAPTTD